MNDLMPRDQQELQASVKAIMARVYDKRASNAPILGINQKRIMDGKNGGLPMHLYHATLPPVIAVAQAQVDDLIELGFQATYIHQEFPKALYRRNMGDRFYAHDYVETKIVTSESDEEALRTAPRRDPKVLSNWFPTPEELPALKDPQTEEDKDLMIARLSGQVEALELVGSGKKK